MVMSRPSRSSTKGNTVAASTATAAAITGGGGGGGGASPRALNHRVLLADPHSPSPNLVAPVVLNVASHGSDGSDGDGDGDVTVSL